MNALVCMQAKKRRLHAVPRCGSDRLKLHFREGSVADISRLGPPIMGRAQRLTRPKRGILTTITHELKIFFDPFQSEERNEK